MPATAVVHRLHEAGHDALLAGGCVRDLLRGSVPEDFDVATSARPEEVAQLFRKTRHVGAAFGVVLVRSAGLWVEVATFRTDGNYRDGRRPESVQFSDAEHDAQRRDFTVNGMFLDPLTGRVIDYVNGRSDLAARLIRAIGDPAARFAEDHLRLLRAVRFAARLDFEIEAATAAAIRDCRARLATVARERVREELERMLAHHTRAAALRLLLDCELTPYLWPGAAELPEARLRSLLPLVARLPPDVPLAFELVFAILLAETALERVAEITRSLAFSNEQRDALNWLLTHQADLDDPGQPALAELKRLLAHPACGALRAWVAARWATAANGPARQARLDERLAAIPPERINPPPLVSGDDLLARGAAPGPLFKRLLDEIYTRQLSEELSSREQALQVLDALLANEGR